MRATRSQVRTRSTVAGRHRSARASTNAATCRARAGRRRRQPAETHQSRQRWMSVRNARSDVGAAAASERRPRRTNRAAAA